MFLFRLRAALALCAASLAFAGDARAEGAIHERIPYAGDAEDAPTLDLYLPAPSDTRPPLLAFVQSRFWQDDRRVDELVHGLARPLQHEGAAVALIRHRAAPQYAHPRQAEDVAAALAYLFEHADEYGYDPARIALAGRGSGAQLAALVALDPHYLAEHHLSPDALIGVGAHSGVYDLDPEGGFENEEERETVAEAFPKPADRKSGSPISHLRADAPLFLVTFAEADVPDAEPRGLAFAKALRDAGHPAAEAFGIPGRDYRSQLDLNADANPLRQHLLALLGLGPAYTSLSETFAMRRFWRDPSFHSADFWKDSKQVKTHDATPEFSEDLNLPFIATGGTPRLHPQHYQALDLIPWLERHADRVGRGRYLVLTNARGEKAFFSLAALREVEPQIVIGIDAERELFRIVDFYHTDRRTTWQQPEVDTWILARPVGAFLYFAKPAPPSIDARAIGRFSLTPESFAVVDADPLAPLGDLAPADRELVTDELHCIGCHAFRGVGGRASHLRARDGERVGGYGLPLEEYPPPVWRRYCFEQAEVAGLIGANPVPLGEHAQALFELVERERARTATPPP
ncbi:MAG TPA: alpha/beta hydrolase [Myxococcota bacterium]|nr:alpha/beta hydrolase [Myxococcota bacterium]